VGQGARKVWRAITVAVNQTTAEKLLHDQSLAWVSNQTRPAVGCVTLVADQQLVFLSNIPALKVKESIKTVQI
jgi:hypothetical protein